jgi:hypothetical protein
MRAEAAAMISVRGGRQGKKIHLMRSGTTVAVCGIGLYPPVAEYKVDLPARCSRCLALKRRLEGDAGDAGRDAAGSEAAQR